MASLNNISTAAGPLSDTYAESLNPQRLALLKLSASSGFGLNDGRENFSEPPTPTGSKHRRALGSRASLAGGSALARSTRQVSTMSSRRTASFMQSHRHKMSLELTAQAEKRFLTLMELMANASKEASSLKEYWTRLMVDRESEDREKEQLLIQIDEITQSLEERDNQQDTHKREATNRKKEVEKLLIELSAALATVDEHKKKVFERDAELERAHNETAEIRATLSRTHVEHEQLRSNYESVQAKLRVAESELTQAKDEVERFRSDFRSLTREHSDLKSRNADLTASLEAARKEIIPLTERIRGWELEKTGILYEKDKVESQFRKQTLKTDELQRELTDLTERYERLQRENTRSRELVTKTELERDEQQGAAERFRHEAKDATTRLEEVEGQREETLLQLEQSRRHAASIEERIIEKDSTISRLQQQLDERQEGYRLIVIERDQLRDDLEGEHKSAHTSRQKIISLEEQLLQAEHKLTELRSESHTVTERIRVVEGERDDARNKHARVSSEIEALSARIVILQGEVRAANEARDHKHAEVDHYKQKYEEVTETIEEWNNDSSELEIEIENLRVMLREAREQKEKAISGRNTADRERDEYISLYEEKCRELERLEESSARASSYFSSSAHGHSGARSSSYRVVSRKSGGTSSGVHNGHTEEHTHTSDAA